MQTCEKNAYREEPDSDDNNDVPDNIHVVSISE